MPDTVGFSLLGARRIINITCCIKVGFIIIVPITAVNLRIRTVKNRSMLGCPSNCLSSLEAVTHVCIRMQHLK